MKLKKVCFSSFLAIFFALSTNVYAEEKKPIVELSPDRFDGVTFISVGGTILNLANVNNALAAKNYPAFSSNLLSISTGSRTTSASRIVTGSEASFSLENKNLNMGNGYKSFFSSSASIIGNLGYVVYSTDTIKIYPIFGAGVGRTTVDLFKDEKTPTFQELLNRTERGTSLSAVNIIGDLGIGADYTLKVGRSLLKKGGINFGVKAGYVFTVYSTGLQQKGENIFGSPDINNNGPYIRAFVGYNGSIIAALLDLF